MLLPCSTSSCSYSLLRFSRKASWKSMHLSEALGQAGEAIGRLERLLEYKPLSQPEKPEKPTAFDVCYDHVRFSYPDATQIKP